MTYDVVLEGVTQRMTKPGPTGLMTTSTRQIGEQLSTRMLSVTINDTPQQTREIVRAHAATAAGRRGDSDVSAFIAAQRWLAFRGDHEVVVPFAAALAEIVPVEHVRMRRDSRQLMTVIEAVALLYQRQRARDEQGRVVSTLGDYAMARELVLPTFQTATSGGLTAQLRETVDALRALYGEMGPPVTVKALGDALGLIRNTAWYRVQRCIALSYVVNVETRKGQPAKLMPGDPMPEDRPPLPTVEELEAYMCDDTPPDPPGSIEPLNGLPHSDSEVTSEAVQSPVQPPIEPAIEPPESADSDSDEADFWMTVQRFNDNPPEKAPPDTHIDNDLVHPGLCPGGCGRYMPYGMMCVTCATKPAQRYH
jgi:hypothetical protein